MSALAVLGMHRSYTSLAARWLSECGIDMGETTLAGGIGNQDGHFEDMDFLAFHTRVLLENDLASNGMAELGGPAFRVQSYLNLKIKGQLAEEGRELLSRKLTRSKAFGWKEPRTCLFLPFYRDTVDPFALVLFRPAQEVVGSLLARERRILTERVFPGWRKPRYWLAKKQWDERLEGLRQSYLDAWLHYNECLLAFVEEGDRNRVMVHDRNSLIANDSVALESLRSWGFACRNRKLGDMVKVQPPRPPIELGRSEAERVVDVTARFYDLIER